MNFLFVFICFSVFFCLQEHLELFGALKGLSGNNLSEAVLQSISEVQLMEKIDAYAGYNYISMCKLYCF